MAKPATLQWSERMKRAVIGLATWIGVAFVAAAPTSSAVSDFRPVSSIYDLYLGGIKAGELTMDATVAGDRYNAQSIMRTAGMVGFFYKASFEAKTEGALTPGGMFPTRFLAASRMKKKEQYVEMIYGANSPKEVRADPAFVPKPWQIDPTKQEGAFDPITAALWALAPKPVDQICNTSVEVFDGRRRYAVDVGAPVADGKRIKCPAMYRRIAGFKPKMMKKRPTFPFSIWYEERPDGLAHVVRAAGDSMFGIAVVLLRE